MRRFAFVLIAAALQAAVPSSEAAMTNPITYAAYRSRCGDDLQPPYADNVSVELTRAKVSAWVNGRRPSMIYVGPVDEGFRNALVAFFNSIEPAAWPGIAKKSPDHKKNNCVWSVTVRTSDWKEKLDAEGEDTAQGGPRLEAEARLMELFQANIPRLQREMPKTLTSLSFTLMKPFRYYTVSVNDQNGLVSVKRREEGRREPEFYVDPKLMPEMQKLAQDSRLDDWHGFASAESRQDDFSLSLRYNTFQSVYAHGSLQNTPPGYAEVSAAIVRRITELADRCAKLDAALPPRIRQFHFSESGMMQSPGWVYYERLDDDGIHPYLRCTMGKELLGEGRVSPELQAKFEQFFKDVSRWDGFHGTNMHVLDGWGFALSATYSDGRKEFSASGSNNFPAGYKERSEELKRLFFKVVPRESLKPYY